MDGATGVARSRARVASDLVKRLLIAIAGALGIRALLRRRHQAAEPPVDELRQKLAEAKAPAGEREEFEAGEVPVDQVPDPPPPPQDADARRSAVHERARQAMDELKDS